MPSMNNCEIIGHVGSEPEMRFTPSGKPVASFSVAVNNTFTTAAGEKKEQTEWFAITVWGKLAETCNQWLSKGKLVFVAGRVNLERWEAQDGGMRSKLALTAGKVLFLSGKSGSDSEPEPEENEPQF